MVYIENMKDHLPVEHKYELESVKHVKIKDSGNIKACPIYFPNAIELTFDDTSYTTYATIIKVLNGILPLDKLTKLTINVNHFSIKKVVKILCHAPNLQTISLETIYDKISNNYTSIRESSDFQKAFKINHVQEFICKRYCKLEQIQLLIALCSQLKYLTVEIFQKDSIPIVRFLFDPNNPNTRQLCLLRVSAFSSSILEQRNEWNQANIFHELDVNYTLKCINVGNFMVWLCFWK